MNKVLLSLILVVLICGGVVAYFGFWKEDSSMGEVQEEVGDVEEDVPLANVELGDCLSEKMFDEECRVVLGNVGVEEGCPELENSDACFYEIARLQGNSDICKNIGNVRMNEDCIEDIRHDMVGVDFIDEVGGMS